jgi:hypothetical protein
MGFEIKKKIYHVTIILYQAIRGRQIEMRRLGFSCIIRWLSFDDYIIRPYGQRIILLKALALLKLEERYTKASS